MIGLAGANDSIQWVEKRNDSAISGALVPGPPLARIESIVASKVGPLRGVAMQRVLALDDLISDARLVYLPSLLRVRVESRSASRSK